MNVLSVHSSPDDSEAQRIIDELIAEAQTPADVAAIGEMQAELDASRAEALANGVGDLAMRPDGTIDAASVISAEMQAGAISHVYGRGSRRA